LPSDASGTPALQGCGPRCSLETSLPKGGALAIAAKTTTPVIAQRSGDIKSQFLAI
jgi:hypothetical protein